MIHMGHWIDRIDSAIKWGFYLIFFITPLAMWPDTYELFEFNKMWVVFGLAIFIFFLWGAKSVLKGSLEIRRTPLDIPIALFLISQIISTILSIDPHVSLWGYYSRFNGGLFSILAYIFLYYAFASNLTLKTENENPISYRLLVISLLSGFAVTLWGIPSHFGYDLTCLVFRGQLNTNCWTEAFQPTVRMFSTLGQPNWMGAFLAALIPISLGFGLYNLKLKTKNLKLPILFLVLSIMFYVALLWTRSQSSFVGLTISLVIFMSILIYHHFIKTKQRVNFSNEMVRFLIAIIALFGIITFFMGTPIESLNKYTTLSGVRTLISKPKAISQKPIVKSEGLEGTSNIQLGGTESSKIRLIVWQGAIELFKHNPLFGTGVETFAYAYYNVRPLAHNLTSEWDYLYNKAHNEYLNYLATTGAFGLVTYLLILTFFLYYATQKVLKPNVHNSPILIGIIGAYLAIAISNFFGFSVVILNLFLFMLPIFFFDLSQNKTLAYSRVVPIGKGVDSTISPPQASLMVILALLFLYFEFYLLNFWLADRKYSLGYNLNKAGEYVQAYTLLSDASKMLPSEDLYKDELSINMATLAILLSDQKQTTQTAQFMDEAKRLSDEVTRKHPKNIVFLKTGARVAFALAQIDPKYLNLAIETVNKTRELAPTDAKLVYNLALFYNQKEDTNKTIEYFEEALKLKSNYLDVYYARALFYSNLAKGNSAKSFEYKTEARKSLEYILKNIDPTHAASKDLLKTL